MLIFSFLQVLLRNVKKMTEMQICTFFSPDLSWKQQLRAIMGKFYFIMGKMLFLSCNFSSTQTFVFSGETEVEILDKKLQEAKIKDLSFLKLKYESLFPLACPESEIDEFKDLQADVGSWPTVSSNFDTDDTFLTKNTFYCKKYANNLLLINLKVEFVFAC